MVAAMIKVVCVFCDTWEFVPETYFAPQQRLYFFPEPHGQGAFRLTLPHVLGSFGSISAAASRRTMGLGGAGFNEIAPSSPSIMIGSTLASRKAGS